MDLGHLFKDTESFVLAWGTSGLWVTTADAITNTTATGDAPWDVTRHTYVRSVGATRLAFVVAFLFLLFVGSITKPDEVCHRTPPLLLLLLLSLSSCSRRYRQPNTQSHLPLNLSPHASQQRDPTCQCSILKNSARRTVGGAQFSLDKATTPSGAEKEAVEAERGEGDTGTIEETNQAQAECEFDELKLNEAREKAIENLREEEEVVVLMPSKEFVIPHGPKRTVLYWLCRDVERTEKINDYLEGEPQRTGLRITPTYLVSH